MPSLSFFLLVNLTIMKIISLLLCLWAVTSPLQAQLSSISFPRYSDKSTDNLEITRIERTDTATIFFMEVYNSPNYWVRLSSATILQGADTGKSYKLLSSKGFELDKQIYMPASGNASFQLFFEPVGKQEQKIHFIEGKAEGDYVIKNIELNENYKKARIRCHITGTVTDRPQSSRLMLYTGMTNMQAPWKSIPIHNGSFDYTIYTNKEDKCHLVFWDDFMNGVMIPVPFFAENGTIQFKLFPYQGSVSKSYEIITDAPLTGEMLAHKKQQNTLFQFDDIYAAETELQKAGKYYTETYHSFWKKFDETKIPEERDKLYKERDRLEESGAFYTDTALVLINKYTERSDSLMAWNFQYATQHSTLPNLYLLMENAKSAKATGKDLIPHRDAYNKVFKAKFKNHPAGKAFSEFIASIDIKVGGQYIDFTAPNLEGKEITLSDMIKDKVALIDFWASWCGPCRRHSKSIIPVFNKYKEKGFTVIGVARERNNAKDMKAAIEKDGYPWINLVEINDKAQIWSKYGISNAAGGSYLIDKTGRILAVNPSAEEIEDILEKVL